jgi:hypothetical protein
MMQDYQNRCKQQNIVDKFQANSLIIYELVCGYDR